MKISGQEAIGNLLGWQIDNEFLKGKSDVTRKAYIKYIRDFFRVENLKDIPFDEINSVSVHDAQLYHEDLKRQGFQSGSINQQMIALSHFYDFLWIIKYLVLILSVNQIEQICIGSSNDPLIHCSKSKYPNGPPCNQTNIKP